MSSSGENLLSRLHELTLVILDTARPAYSLRQEVLDLKALLIEAAGSTFETREDISLGETRTEHGVAISPTMAVMCLDDFARTVQFLRGAYDAVLDLRHRIFGRPVRVLYAGCGPLAPLAIPLMSMFGGDETRFILLDIHRGSIESARTIVTNLRLTNQVESFDTADADAYSIDSGAAPDLILLEMLRAALESEPHVAVARHLHLEAPGAVVIPEEIRVELALVNQAREFSVGEFEPERDRIRLGTFFRLDLETLKSPPLPAVRRVPDFDTERYRPMLLTTVRVYREHVLKDYDSGITCPKKLNVARDIKPGDTIEFAYQLTNDPHIAARITE